MCNYFGVIFHIQLSDALRRILCSVTLLSLTRRPFLCPEKCSYEDKLMNDNFCLYLKKYLRYLSVCIEYIKRNKCSKD